MSTSSQNLIHFAIRYHRENIWVLQLHIADSEKKNNSILCVAGKEINFSRRVWCEQYEPKKSHTRLKSNFDRLLIIFFITQIHRVRTVSLNGEASSVINSRLLKPTIFKFSFMSIEFQYNLSIRVADFSYAVPHLLRARGNCEKPTAVQTALNSLF